MKRKRIFLTGAAGGFGQEFVAQYLEQGHSLQVTDINETAYEVLKENFPGANIEYLKPFTLSDPAAVENWLAGKPFPEMPDLVVLNAGVANLGEFESFSWEKQRNLMEVNLMAPMRLFYYFLPFFKERGWGQFLLISSVAGQLGPGYLASYASSKFGLRGFGEAMIMELEESPIKVSLAFPFFTNTKILDSPASGDEPWSQLPRQLVESPVNVVKQMINEAEQNKTHIFPGPVSPVLSTLHRVFPPAITLIRKLAGV